MNSSNLKDWIRCFREDLRLRDMTALTRHVEEAGLEVMLHHDLLALACQQDARAVVVLIASIGESNGPEPAVYSRWLAVYQYLQNQISLDEAITRCNQSTGVSEDFYRALLKNSEGRSTLNFSTSDFNNKAELEFAVQLLSNTGNSRSIIPWLDVWRSIDNSDLPWLKACRAVISRASFAYTKNELKQLADTIENLINIAPQEQSEVCRQLYIEWARVSFESGEGETAVRAAERAFAITSDPEDRFMLAKSLILAGQMDAGIQHLKELLIFTLDNPESAGNEEPKIPFVVSEAEDTLVLVNNILCAKGLQPFLMAGTLLGCIRDGHLLPHDKDIDIGLVGWERQFEVAEALVESGAFYIDLSEVSGKNRFVLSANDIRNGTAVDFFFFHDMGDHYLQGINFDIGFLQNLRFTKFGLQKINFLEHDFYAPDNIDLYLTENYEDWRTPVSSYLVTVESPALVNDTFPRTILIYLETIKTILYDLSPKRLRRILDYIERSDWFSFDSQIHLRLQEWCLAKEKVSTMH